VSSAGPTLCFDHLTPAQVRAFRIADNRLTEISVRDGRLLAEQLKELLLLGLDFNIEAAGFDKGEIGFRIASLEGSVRGRRRVSIEKSQNGRPRRRHEIRIYGQPISQIGVRPRDRIW
jgi:hypothetical protein